MAPNAGVTGPVAGTVVAWGTNGHRIAVGTYRDRLPRSVAGCFSRNGAAVQLPGAGCLVVAVNTGVAGIRLVEIATGRSDGHRAAIGMSEESDSLVIIVSEETGAISTAYKGQLVRGISQPKLRATLTSVFVTPIRNRSIKGWFKSLKDKPTAPPLETKTTHN